MYILDTSIVNYVGRLVTKRLSPGRDYIDLIDTLYEPGSDTTTNGIRIRATSHFNPWGSNVKTELLFVYQIRISDNGVLPGKRYKLVSRYWEIVEGLNEKDKRVVNGPGVIGMYPEVYQGCADFTYESCSPIKCREAVMRGSFRFKEMKTGEIVEALISPFKLSIPDHSFIVDFESGTKTVNIL